MTHVGRILTGAAFVFVLAFSLTLAINYSFELMIAVGLWAVVCAFMAAIGWGNALLLLWILGDVLSRPRPDR